MSRSKRRKQNREQQAKLAQHESRPTMALNSVDEEITTSHQDVQGALSAPGELTACQIAFWTQCQTRVVGYLTTNGTLQIALCGMFATVAGILLSLADPSKNQAQFDRIFHYILPAFCCVMLSLSGNVYSWIEMQLAYIRHTGVNPVQLRFCPTYDQYKDLITMDWAKLPISRRIVISTLGVLFDFVLLPFKIGNIYCYYLALYIVSGILFLAYGHKCFQWWFPLPFLLLFGIVTHTVRRVRAVKARIQTQLCIEPATAGA